MHHRLRLRLNWGDQVLERSQMSVAAVVVVAVVVVAVVASFDVLIGLPFRLSVRQISNVGSLAALADLASPASLELD